MIKNVKVVYDVDYLTKNRYAYYTSNSIIKFIRDNIDTKNTIVNIYISLIDEKLFVRIIDLLSKEIDVVFASTDLSLDILKLLYEISIDSLKMYLSSSKIKRYDSWSISVMFGDNQ